MGRYEIGHFHEGRGHTIYNNYHNCTKVEDAIERHVAKGYKKQNIRSITHHVKRKFSIDEVTKLVND